MELWAAGVNHTTADVALREQLAFVDDHASAALAALKALPQVNEVALLSTCNRMELYCLCSGELDLTGWLAQWHQLSIERIRSALYVHRGEAAMRHMMRVASGLDSQVLGEPQILGQMHNAYDGARDAGSMSGALDQIFQQVFATAKQVRTETAIGENPVSVASAAVAFARHIFSDMSKSRVLLIGAGEMIALVARYLRQQQVRQLTIVNRTPAHAAELAAEVNADVESLERLDEELAHADIVISCTGSPQPLVTATQMQQALKWRRHRPVFMVDMAIPRDVEAAVGELQDVYLYTLDHLQQAIDENLSERQQAAAEGLEMIDAALDAWKLRMREGRALDLVKSYRKQVDAVSQQSLKRALTSLEKGRDANEVLERFRHDLVNKLLHHPSVVLRKLAADERIDDLLVAEELLLDAMPAKETPATSTEGPSGAPLKCTPAPHTNLSDKEDTR